MRTRQELMAIPLEDREEALMGFTGGEMRQLTRGYAVSAEAITEYLHEEAIVETIPADDDIELDRSDLQDQIDREQIT